MKKNLLSLLLIIAFAGSANAQAPCVGSQSLTATPLPSPTATYTPGTVVTFCYTVSNYSQSGADWIAGVVPTLGGAWDAATLQPVSAAASCDGAGQWGWYTSCFGTASGQTWGPGFYYDTPAGSPGGTLDGIPGNNYGDNCQSHTWTFCFSVTVGQCTPIGSGSLYMGVTALSDYSAGSWGTNACIDPPAVQNATIECCALEIPNFDITDASCSGNDGELTAYPLGTPPYTYLWNNGATTQTNSNLAPGIYTVTVTDGTSCSKSVTVVVGGPPPIVLNETVVDNTCNTNEGSISLSPTGGSGANFTFLWNDGSTTSSISNLPGGTYTVTVTDSAGCTNTGTYNISAITPIGLTTSSTSAGCTTNDGTATAVVTGGTAPYTYNWQPIGGNGPVATNLPGGTYTVTVTDANGCTLDDQVVVQQAGSFTLSTTFVPLTCDPLGTTTATVTPSGGTPPFTYQWSPTGGNQATATGLSSGTYTVLVTDTNNCVETATVVIPPVVPVTLGTLTNPVQCNQPNSGTATVAASGGTPPYTYLWSDGSTGSTASNLAGGTYTVTVTDVNGCSATETVTITVIPDVFASAGTDQTVCNGDPANLSGSASGGTAPFSYSWSNGVNTQNQTVNPTATTSYVLTVTDANGCQATSTVTVTVVDYPVVTVSSDTDICFGSSTTLTASGGDTYSWSPPDGLNDTNIPNPVASPATTTTYTVTVSNSQCSATGSVTVNVAPAINAGFFPDTTLGQTPLTVNFTNTTVAGTNYVWNFGDGTTSTDPDPTHVFTQLGSYTVEMIAYNSFGCTDTVRYSFIVVESSSILVIPNVFTPNGDNYNDTFSFLEQGIGTINVVILNRWGKEVYSWNRLNGSWDGKSKDGKELPDGVYVYIIQANSIDGKAYNFEGTVQLIRNKK